MTGQTSSAFSAAETKAKAIVLLPHQQAIKQRALANDIEWPFYLIWQMGSGKTYGALTLLYAVSHLSAPRVLILCPLSLVGQWRAQIQRFMSRCAGQPPKGKIVVAHYEQLDRGEAVPKRFDLTIVDEAARFRNAFKTAEDDEGRRPEILHYEIASILKCQRIAYLSGTPILASPHIERRALDTMMRVNPTHPLSRRLSIYDPREDPDFMRRFATRKDIVVRVPMRWSQTLLYFIFKRRPMKLLVGGATLVADVETGNAFESQLVKIANNPFTRPKFVEDDPESSPKIIKLVERVEELLEEGRKQLVYSCRKGEGVEQVRFLLVSRALSKTFGTRVCWRDVAQTRSAKSPLPTKIARAARELLAHKFLLLSGDMSSEDRFNAVRTFNQPNGKHRHGRVLHFTQAAANGVDLAEAGDIHLLEPNIIKAMEDQVIARGLRLYAHKKGDRHEFGCHRYIATFPDAQAPLDEDNFRDVLSYFREYRRGGAETLTSEQLLAIRAALASQHVAKEACSVDEKHQRDAEERNVLVKREIELLRAYDPDGQALLGQKQEAMWARRSRELAREMKRADDETRAAILRGSVGEPSARGWDGSSRCATAIRFMRGSWETFLFEDYPGMHDRAWRAVRHRFNAEGKDWPDERSDAADDVRRQIRDEVNALHAKERDTLRDKKFYRQVLGNGQATLTRQDVDAFKRALIARGYVVAAANTRGWRWASAEQTYKVVPRPGQTGHASLVKRFQTECMKVASVPHRPGPK